MATSDYSRFSAEMVCGGKEHTAAGAVVREAYNAGWVAEFTMMAVKAEAGGFHQSDAPTLAEALGLALDMGIQTGQMATVNIIEHVETETGNDKVVESFPGMIAGIHPFQQSEGLKRPLTFIRVVVEDVVNYLGNRPIWGAFRGHTAAEMFGGALALAAGADGRPTLQPVVPGYSASVTIEDGLRGSLDYIPYGLATGQAMAVWVAEFMGLLGIRMEMGASSTGDITIKLSDGPPADTSPLKMDLARNIGANPADGTIAISRFGAYRGADSRAVVLDDTTKGEFRRLYPGPVGRIVTGEEIGVEEAHRRAEYEVRGRAAELLIMTVLSSRPAVRPGRLIELPEQVVDTLAWSDTWQVAMVKHEVLGNFYENTAYILNGEVSWHPRHPPQRAAVIVPAYVDAGDSFARNAPVPRDHLGRIRVGFPFTPSKSVEEAFDITGEGRITKDDFEDLIRNESVTDTEWRHMDGEGMKSALSHAAGENSWLDAEMRTQAAFLLNTAARDADLEKLADGEYDDPFPGVPDDALTLEQQTERRTLLEQRIGAFRYKAWKRAIDFENTEGDYDHDGVLTVLDDRMSEELRSRFAEVETHLALRRDAQAVSSALARQDERPETETPSDIVDEYLSLYGENTNTADPGRRTAELQRNAVSEQWPARLPLPVVQPMAGGMHGFVTGHRQGDACRVAVHNALHAEIIGFQYRSDRDLKASIGGGATAGIVVEHDMLASWSGLLFHQTK